MTTISTITFEDLVKRISPADKVAETATRQLAVGFRDGGGDCSENESSAVSAACDPGRQTVDFVAIIAASD